VPRVEWGFQHELVVGSGADWDGVSFQEIS
jgi:hypothetical protein